MEPPSSPPSEKAEESPETPVEEKPAVVVPKEEEKQDEEEIKPSTSTSEPASPNPPTSEPSKPLVNGLTHNVKPIAKVEPLDTSMFAQEPLPMDEKPSTSASHSPVEKENKPIKEEEVELENKPVNIDEDEGDYSEEFEEKDTSVKEESNERLYTKDSHVYLQNESIKLTDIERDKLKALEKVPAYHFVQKWKFKSMRTCARTYLCYNTDEPEYWKKRKQKKEQEKRLTQAQPQTGAQNLMPNNNAIRQPVPAQIAAGNLLRKVRKRFLFKIR